jgi:lysophospholipase L1-like esterase
MDEGKGATRSLEGALRIAGALATRRPAYTLILYGTNDWNQCKGEVPCITVDNLRLMIESTKSAQSHPILATIIPANPDYPDQVPPERNEWVHQIDALLRDLARQEEVPLADLEAAFLAQASLPDLFADHIHPNDRGYDLIAEGFLKAITGARGGTGSTGFVDALGFDLEGGEARLPPFRGPRAHAFPPRR